MLWKRVSWPSLAILSVVIMLGCGGNIKKIHISSKTSRHPVVTFDSKDNPLVAWSEGETFETEPSDIFVKYWNTKKWIELKGSASSGGISNNGNSSRRPSVAVSNSNLIVAWEDDAERSAPAIFVKKWDATSWSEYPTGSSTTSASGYGISMTELQCRSPSVFMDGSGNPIVVWTQYASVPGIFGKRWDGVTWLDLPGSDSEGRLSPSNVEAFNASASLNNSGNLVLAYEIKSGGTSYISVREWTGSVWKEYDLPPWNPDAIGSGQHPSLAIKDGTIPVVAWEDDRSGTSKIYISFWDSSASGWKPYGSSLVLSQNTGSRNAWNPSLTLNSSGSPIVAWRESWVEPGGLVHSLVHSRKWHSGVWKSVSGKADNRLSQAMNGNVADPSVAVDSKDGLIVVWSQDYFIGDTTGYAGAATTPEDIESYWTD